MLENAWNEIGYTKAIQGNLNPVLLHNDFSLVKKQVDTIFLHYQKKKDISVILDIEFCLERLLKTYKGLLNTFIANSYMLNLTTQNTGVNYAAVLLQYLLLLFFARVLIIQKALSHLF